MRHAALIALALAATASALTADLHAHGRRHRARYAAREPAPPPPDDLSTRRLRALDGFARSGHVRRCWMQQLQRDPLTTSRTLVVRLEVDAQGRTRGASVSDPGAPGLARCLAAGAWGLAPVGPGEGFVAESTVHLDRPE